MSASRIAAVILIIGGLAGLAYGRLTFTRDREKAKLGPISVTVEDRDSVRVPQWVAIAAIAGGVLMLFTDKRAYRT
jgi:hypothetical protein